MKTAARRDRLLNLLHRGSTTVPCLARTLEISERTAYRDIAALREAGHTIHATPGPGGGMRISADSRPRPVHFEVAEIIGLALSVAILKATPHMPFAGSAEAALDRARRALSADRQRAMRRLERRILIGPPSSDRTKTTLSSVDDALLTIFERCFTAGRQMAFDYVDRHGAETSRRIECVALVLRAPAWYVVAWDLDKDDPRTFRMDRMSRPSCGELLAESHPLPLVKARTCPDAEAAYEDWIGTPIG
jgi:predicted DNA-binding transcriptional regulator YafY